MAFPDVTLSNDDLVCNPGIRSQSPLNNVLDQTFSFHRIIEKLSSDNLKLKGLGQKALHSADAASLLFGGLSRHEAASIWLLLNSHVKSLFTVKQGLELAELTTRGLCKLPTYTGCLWYKTQTDVSALYKTGQIFTWPGHFICSTEKPERFLETENKTTVFSIDSMSGRMTVPFTTDDNSVTVVILPDSYFQVLSVTELPGLVSLIHVKEVAKPNQLENNGTTEATDKQAGPDYWDIVFQGFSPDNAPVTAARVLSIGCLTADVKLQNMCLQRLAQIPAFECPVSASDTLVAKTLAAMERYKSHGTLQFNGCCVLKAICPQICTNHPYNGLHLDGIVSAVLEAMTQHSTIKALVVCVLELLSALSDHHFNSSDIRVLIDSVLSSTKVHRDDKAVQHLCCVLLDKVARTSECARSIVAQDGFRVVLNAIRLHRGDPSISDLCWRLLLRLHSGTKTAPNGNLVVCCNSVRELLCAYSQDLTVQEEGILLLWNIAKERKTAMITSVPYLQVVISALRLHCQSSQLVECAFGLLSQMLTSTLMTNFAVNNDAISLILLTMNKHFNLPEIQKYGCKILRLIAANGYRRYREDSTSGADHCSEPPQNAASRADHRLAVVEAGGTSVVLSAMKTHSDDAGVLRQGCLAVRTLAVNSENEVETKSPEVTMAILRICSNDFEDLSLEKATLRALVILVINPNNRDLVVDSGGVENVLFLLASRTLGLQTQEDALAILSHLAETPKGALDFLRCEGIARVYFLMESCKGNDKILTSSCNVLANAFAHSHEVKESELMLYCIDKAYHVITQHPHESQLVLACCRALSSFPEGPGIPMYDLLPLVQAMTCYPDNQLLLEIACKAIGRLAIVQGKGYFWNPMRSNVTPEIVQNVLKVLANHPEARNLQIEGLKTLMTAISQFPSLEDSFSRKEGLQIVETLQLHKGDKAAVIAGLKLLRSIYFSSLKTTGVWGSTMFEKKIYLPVKGMCALLPLIGEHVTDDEIVKVGQTVLHLCCDQHKKLPKHFCQDLKQLLLEIKRVHPWVDEKSTSERDSLLLIAMHIVPD